jgi:hypothetical protein
MLAEHQPARLKRGRHRRDSLVREAGNFVAWLVSPMIADQILGAYPSIPRIGIYGIIRCAQEATAGQLTTISPRARCENAIAIGIVLFHAAAT